MLLNVPWASGKGAAGTQRFHARPGSPGEVQIRSLLLVLQGRRPPESGGHGGPVVFALVEILRAAIVEAEHFVVDVKAVHHKTEAVAQAEASWGVDFEVRVQVVVAERASNAAREAILELIRKDIGLVVREPESHG